MGEKGDKSTQNSAIAAEEIAAKLASIAGIFTKKMFSGYGLFHEGKMFGIIDSKGKSYLKVDDTIKADFENQKSEQHGKMPYFSIPQEVLNNNHELVLWAKKSIEISK